MKIDLTPIRSDATLSLVRTGDTLSINGISYDFSPLPDGARLPRTALDCPWVASDVERSDNRICLTLFLPHGPEMSLATRFPAPIIDPADGPVPLPLQKAEDRT